MHLKSIGDIEKIKTDIDGHFVDFQNFSYFSMMFRVYYMTYVSQASRQRACSYKQCIICNCLHLW